MSGADSHCEDRRPSHRFAGPKPVSSRYEVGYGRPPKGTRWQVGQCGNPKRKRKRSSKPIVDMIDEFFAGEIDLVEKGISRRFSTFEAIVLALWFKAIAGRKRATNVLLQYQAFAVRQTGGMGGAISTIEIVGRGRRVSQKAAMSSSTKLDTKNRLGIRNSSRVTAASHEARKRRWQPRPSFALC